MAQITIYLDQKQAAAIRSEANRRRKSVSKWVTEAVQEKLSRQWPKDVVNAAGSWNDFPEISELRKIRGADISREKI